MTIAVTEALVVTVWFESGQEPKLTNAEKPILEAAKAYGYEVFFKKVQGASNEAPGLLHFTLVPIPGGDSERLPALMNFVMHKFEKVASTWHR